jgi:RNA polymerase sigma-70 factor, ECF subfamily
MFMATASSSKTLIGRIAAGDHEALGEFYDRFASMANGLALRILRNTSDAEEVVQEVFLQAWRQADRYDAARGTPEAWISTLARTRALDKLRRRASRREEASDAAPGTTSTPANVEVLAVRKALDSLSGPQRRALELAYYDGLTQSEIATRLGEPLGTIKTRIRTAMLRLRESLAPVSDQPRRPTSDDAPPES